MQPPRSGTARAVDVLARAELPWRGTAERALSRRGVAGVALFAACAATAAVARAPTLSSTVPADAGAYLYIGRLMRDGGLPYVDAIDNKGPLTYSLFALLDAVVDGSSAAVRVALIAFAAVAALGVAGYVGRLAGRATGVAAGLVFAVVGSAPWQGSSPNTEQFGAAPMTIAWWLSTRRELASAVAAGALVAAATLMNVGFAACAVPVALELARGQPGRRRAALAGALAGGVAVVAAVGLWLAARGALGTMLEQYLGYGGDALSGAVAATPRFARRIEVPHLALVLMGLAGCLVAARGPRYRRAATGAGLWIALMLVRAKLSPYDGDPFLHHYYPMTPGIAAGLALGGAALWTHEGRFSRRARAAAIAAIATFVAIAYVIVPSIRFERLAYKEDPRELRAAADLVRARTTRDDRILVSGYAPQVYWLAGRDAASRLFSVPRFGFVSRNGNFRTTYRARRQAELLRRPPAAIVVPRTRPDADVRVVLRRLPYRHVMRSCRLSLRERRTCVDVWLRAGAAAGRPAAAG
ncbi:MAG: hypothetical protein ACM3UV_06640 [Nocardioidaceae bacterium]